MQVAAGQIGQPPNPTGQALPDDGHHARPAHATRSSSRRSSSSPAAAGQIVYLRDVGRVELGAQTYDSFVRTQRHVRPRTSLIFQLPGSNALEVAKGVREAMKRIKPTLPQGMEYNIPFDTTKFVDAAIHEVYLTLAEAGVLVLS